MHTTEARAKGESEQRSTCSRHGARRRAIPTASALRSPDGSFDAAVGGHTHAAAYEALKAEFTQEEQVKLTLMINVINGWNRLAVGFGLWVEPAAAKAIAEKAVA